MKIENLSDDEDLSFHENILIREILSTESLNENEYLLISAHERLDALT
jgi:hypothetical protein